VCAPYFINLNNNTFQLKRYYSLFIYVHSNREQKKSSPIICLRHSELSWDLSSEAVCLGLILVALYQVPHSVNILSSAHRVRTFSTGCSINGPRCSQSLLKVLNTTLAPFLVWHCKNYLNRLRFDRVVVKCTLLRFMNHSKNIDFNFSRYGVHINWIGWCAKFYYSRM